MITYKEKETVYTYIHTYIYTHKYIHICIYIHICTYIFRASQVALLVENPPANARDVRDRGLIPGSGRSPGGGNGNPLQYSCLENPMDRGAWWAMVHSVTKSQTRLKQLCRAQHTHMCVYVHLTHFAVLLKLTHYKSTILQSKKKRL